MKNTHLSIPMTQKEQLWGLGFLMVRQLILSKLVWLLPTGSAGIQNLLYGCISFAAVVWIFFRFWKESLKNFPKNIGFFLWRILLSYAGYTVLSGLLLPLLYPLFPGYFTLTEAGLSLISPNDRAIAALLEENFLLTALYAVLLTPLVEEVLHRGVIFGGLHRKSPLAAYVLSSVLFSFIHVMGYLGTADPVYLLLCFLQYLPAGLLLARLYKETDSIFAPILLHMAINAVALFSVR